MRSPSSCSQERPEGLPGQPGERTCRSCLGKVEPEDLTPEELHLCQDCLGRRRLEQQALRQQLSAQYVLLRDCRQVKPCLLKGLAFYPEGFRERPAAEALAADLLKAGFPWEEAYTILRRAAPGISPAKVRALLAEAGNRRAWSCPELRERLSIDCQGCPLQYYQAPQRSAPSQAGLS